MIAPTFSNRLRGVAAVAAALMIAGCGSAESGKSAKRLASKLSTRDQAIETARPDGLPSVPVEAVKPDAPAEPDPDFQARRAIVGKWKQNYTGVRYLSVRPDGTGTMVIDPDWAASLVIGGRLTIAMEWTIEDGHALMKSVSGEPKSAFETVTKLFGKDRNRLIEKLDGTAFVLLDEEDGSRSEWTRIPDGETVPAAIAE